MYKLDNRAMGCIFPVWAIITPSVTSGLILISTILIIAIHRNWEIIKFNLFIKYNFLINDDKPENLDEMEFDACVTCRYTISLYL